MTCSICLQPRALKFQTGRLSICGHCVHSLNSTSLSGHTAKERWRNEFRFAMIHARRHTVEELDGWPDDWWDARLREAMQNGERVRRSHALKVLRAYRGGLVCKDRRYLDYPGNWDFKRYRIKHWDHYACHLCGDLESEGATLHAHHIIHRSHSGTNSDRNLVTLCVECHQQQHPQFQIGTDGGEPHGRDLDDTPDAVGSWDDDWKSLEDRREWEADERPTVHRPTPAAAPGIQVAPPTIEVPEVTQSGQTVQPEGRERQDFEQSRQQINTVGTKNVATGKRATSTTNARYKFFLRNSILILVLALCATVVAVFSILLCATIVMLALSR